jgi:replicative DNA helicase
MGKKVLYFDLEEQVKENIIRICSMIHHKNIGSLLKFSKPGSQEYKDAQKIIQQTTKTFNFKNLYYINAAGSTLQAIQEIIYSSLIDVVIIDHFHVIRTEKDKIKYERYSEIAENLRVLSSNIGGIPIIVAAQANRESQKNAKPTLSDFKGAGEIEEIANTACILQAVYKKNSKEFEPELDLFLLKNKHWKTGEERLNYFRQYSLITEKTGLKAYGQC